MHLLVATSGGADSTALLLALSRCTSTSGTPLRLTACYVDHGLRSADERANEQALLSALCVQLGIGLRIVAVDVAAERQSLRLSWEAAARRCRYEALQRVAAGDDIQAVVTGHTADDQVETVLMRILRGTGVRGLRGMEAATRPWGDAAPLLVRPLLQVTREQTEAYCRQNAVVWAVDSSNRSPRYTRNRVRDELLPALRRVYPGMATALLSVGRQAADLTGWIDGEVQVALDRLWRVSADEAWLRQPGNGMHLFLRAQVVATALARLLGTPGAPSQRVVAAVLNVWVGRPGRRCAIGCGWYVEGTVEGAHFLRDAVNDPFRAVSAWSDERWELGIGSTVLPGWRVTLTPSATTRLRDGAIPTSADPYLTYLPPFVLDHGEELTVRYWRPGARMRPAGMKQDKKLQDIFVDEKVPRLDRRRIPLLYLGDRCIWLVGVKRSDLTAPRGRNRGHMLEVLFERVGTPFAC